MTAGLLGCPHPLGQACGSSTQCPVNSYCLFDQCVAPATVSTNLSVLVTPFDPTLAPQQFLPRQFQTVDGFSTITLNAPQTVSTVNGPVPLPANCFPNDAGYPVEFLFTGSTRIPGVPNTFRFLTDQSGYVFGVLPLGSYAKRISTATACAAPILGRDIVVSAARGFDLTSFSFPAPIVGAIQESDAGMSSGITPATEISGQILVAQSPDAGLPVNALVRILAPLDGGPIAGTAISGDQLLQKLSDGGLWFGSTYVPGGPAALPVPQPPQDGIFQTENDATCVLSSGLAPGTCDYFVVEIGPSPTLPFLPTIDVQAHGLAVSDGGSDRVSLIGGSAVSLPFNPMATFDLTVLAERPGSRSLTSATVAVSTVDGGISACLPPDGGVTCRMNASDVTDQNGMVTIPVVPGRYTVTLKPKLPLGPSTAVVDVLSGGALSSASANIIVGPGGKGQLVLLAAAAAVTVQGTVRQHSENGPPLTAGEVQLLTLPDLSLAAQQALNAGAFNLSVPPGPYLLLIQPDTSTRLPAFYQTIVASAETSSARPIYTIGDPGLLAGVVQIADDGGLPVPVSAFLQFYYVASDPSGNQIAIPVASAVTDLQGQGRWSAPGPPGQ